MDSDSSESEMLPPTQFPRQRPIESSREYSHLIFFNWSSGLTKHFKTFPISEFSEDEIRPGWINYQMRFESRCRPLKPLRKLPGQTVSLFAKIEKG